MTEISNTTPSRAEKNELVKIMAKILNAPPKEVLKSIKLFSNIDPDMKDCFKRLHEMNKKDYVTAALVLGYVLYKGRFATEIIND